MASITIGTHVGSLEITGLLGAGGMGEVYRARDEKLKREVAVKILPEAFARDADRVSRFQREAEVLASLNHSNIAAIYDLQESGDSRILVLELVEGETLADRIHRGPLPVDEAPDRAALLDDVEVAGLVVRRGDVEGRVEAGRVRGQRVRSVVAPDRECCDGEQMREAHAVARSGVRDRGPGATRKPSTWPYTTATDGRSA